MLRAFVGRAGVAQSPQDVIQIVVLHGIRASFDVQGRTVAKVLHKELLVQRRRHQNHFEIGMPRQQIAQNDEQEIGVVIAFVHFVDDQMRPFALKRRLDRQTTEKE